MKPWPAVRSATWFGSILPNLILRTSPITYESVIGVFLLPDLYIMRFNKTYWALLCPRYYTKQYLTYIQDGKSGIYFMKRKACILKQKYLIISPMHETIIAQCCLPQNHGKVQNTFPIDTQRLAWGIQRIIFHVICIFLRRCLRWLNSC